MSDAKVGASPGVAVALVDLGDTLCECASALRAGLRRLRQPGDTEDDGTLGTRPPYSESRRRQVMSAPGFWRNLPPRAAGFELTRVRQFTIFLDNRVGRLGSLVRTLLANVPEARRVRLVCAGEPLATLGGHVACDRPFDGSDLR